MEKKEFEDFVQYSFSTLDINILRKHIEDTKEKASKLSELYADKDYENNFYHREVIRSRNLIEWIELCSQYAINIKIHNKGLILIDNKFIISLSNKKWKVLRKGKWYWYSNPKQFIDKYIFKII